MHKAAMEQNGLQWLGAPSCLRGSIAFYKSVSSRSDMAPPGRDWKLGGFYFVRCGPQEPVCIAEVTLLWEDQAQRHLLASSRLYFLPEDTPKGRTRDHGEDEVLAVSQRIVVRVEDLAKWACTEPPVWIRGAVNGDCMCKNTSSSTELEQPKKNTQGEDEAVSVRVLSYPQYCRYRSLEKRVQELGGWPRLQDPHLKTLEEIRMVQHNTRVLYCRDTFTHPTLDSNASILTQLEHPSICLKGRPRKRKGRFGKVPEQPNTQQSESWIERMSENVLGSAEQQWAGGWLHHPEEKLFLDQLFSFMERRGSPISKVPNLGFKKIDLFTMYSVVKRLGGYENVTNRRHWKTVYNELGGSPGSTSAATCTRRHYEKLMLPYEQFMNTGFKPTKALEPVVPMKPMRGRPPLHLQREKRNRLASPAVSVDGVVVRRGRGRPPGRRKIMAARANQGRPPLQPKPPLSQGVLPPPQGPLALLPPPVLHEQNNSTPRQAQVHTPISSSSTTIPAPAYPLKPEEVKPEPQDLAPPTPRSSGLSQVSPNEQVSPVPKSSGLFQVSPTAAAAVVVGAGGFGISASPAVFSPTKGLCPLDLFRTRLGLGAMATAARLNSTPVTSLHLSPVGQLQQARHSVSGSPVTSSTPTGPPKDPHPLPLHQCSGCVPSEEQGPPGGGGGGGGEGVVRSRSPLPPLRIIPLELDCSLRVRQLMRGSLGSEHVHSFTKRLSEALAQDLELPRATPGTPLPPPSSSYSLFTLPSGSPTSSSPLPPPAVAAGRPQEDQVQPLNLSNWGGTFRPAGDGEVTSQQQHDVEGDDTLLQAPVAKQPRLNADGIPLKANGGVFRFPLFQDQPSDLSLPRRVRALLRENRRVASKSPDPSEPMDTLPHPDAAPCRAGGSSPSVEEQGDGAGVGSSPGVVEIGGADVTPGGEDSGRGRAQVPGKQQNGKGDNNTQLANRVQDVPGYRRALANGDSDAESGHRKLTNGEPDDQAYDRALANGDSDDQDDQDFHMALANGDQSDQDYHMALANGDQNDHDDHSPLANGEPDAVGSFISLMLPDSPPHSHCNSISNPLLS